MQIKWDPRTMGTGFKEIDEEHREMLRAIGELIEASHQGKGKEQIGRMIDFLTGYVMNHFSHEEDVMDRYDCPVREQNRKAHEQFLMDFADLADRFDKDGPTPSFVAEVQSKVLEWLKDHIMGCDAQLKKCAVACQQP